MSDDKLQISVLGDLTIAHSRAEPVVPDLAGIPLGLLAVLAFESCDGAALTGDEAGRICWGLERWTEKDMDARRADFKTALSKMRKAIGDDGRNPKYVVGDFHGLRLDTGSVRVDWRSIREHEQGSTELRAQLVTAAQSAEFRVVANLGLRNVSGQWLENVREQAFDLFDEMLEETAEQSLEDGDEDKALQLWAQRRQIARRRGFDELAADIDGWISAQKQARAGARFRDRRTSRATSPPQPVEEISAEMPRSSGNGGVTAMSRGEALRSIASEIPTSDRVVIAGSVPPNMVGFLRDHSEHLPQEVAICLDRSKRSEATLTRLSEGATDPQSWIPALVFDGRVRLEVEITSSAAYATRVDRRDDVDPAVLRFQSGTRQFELLDHLAQGWRKRAVLPKSGESA